MIRTQSHLQLPSAEFDWPFQTALNQDNTRVKLGKCIRWGQQAEADSEGLSNTQDRPSKDARLVISAVIIKHKLWLSELETVSQIQKNPYLQYLIGVSGYRMEAPFAPSFFCGDP